MRIVLLLALTLLVSGCQYDPHAHLYTMARPQTADVVGRYALVSQTVTTDGISALDGKLSVVELRTDGTFSASNVPPYPLFGSPDAGVLKSLVSAAGSWRVGKVGSVDDGGSLKTHWGIYPESGTVRLQSAGLTGQKAPFGLVFTVGDPDSGHAMFLERTK